MSVPSTTLIISTYNWPEALELCLQSVVAQKVLPDEIIIADDGSNVQTRDVINTFKEEFSIPLHHIWQEDHGFRKALILNKAIKKSSADYIIQIDGDVILHPYFIRDHINVSEDKTFIRGTRAMLNQYKTEACIKNKDIDLSIFSRGLKHRNNALFIPILRNLAIRKEMLSRSVRGSNLAYWKKDFIAINGYNNELQGWGHEDEELAARLINNNIIKKIVKLCAVQYHLHHPESTRDNEPEHANCVINTVNKKNTSCTNGYRSV